MHNASIAANYPPFVAFKAGEELQLATLLTEPEQTVTLTIDLERVCPQVLGAQSLFEAVLTAASTR